MKWKFENFGYLFFFKECIFFIINITSFLILFNIWIFFCLSFAHDIRLHRRFKYYFYFFYIILFFYSIFGIFFLLLLIIFILSLNYFYDYKGNYVNFYNIIISINFEKLIFIIFFLIIFIFIFIILLQELELMNYWIYAWYMHIFYIILNFFLFDNFFCSFIIYNFFLFDIIIIVYAYLYKEKVQNRNTLLTIYNLINTSYFILFIYTCIVKNDILNNEYFINNYLLYNTFFFFYINVLFLLSIYFINNYCMLELPLFIYCIIYMLNPYILTFYIVKLFKYSLITHTEFNMLILICYLTYNTLMINKLFLKNFLNTFLIIILNNYNIFILIMHTNNIWDNLILDWYLLLNTLNSIVIFLYLYIIKIIFFNYNIKYMFYFYKKYNRCKYIFIFLIIITLIILLDIILKNNIIIYVNLYSETYCLNTILIILNIYNIFIFIFINIKIFIF